jgi:uncharacterized protein
MWRKGSRIPHSVGPMEANEPSLRALVYGGAVLGGGGGGSLAAGLRTMKQALEIGEPHIIPLADVPRSAIVATLSAVGSAGKTSGTALDERHFRRAIELFQRFANRRVDGFISSEVGPRAVTYGLLESARTGIPVVDAPANGRAHPLFLMGSLGLHKRPGYAATTVAVGGQIGSANYAEIALRASVVKAAHVVRGHAARSRAALAVVRNAVPAQHLEDNAAVGDSIRPEGRRRAPRGSAARSEFDLACIVPHDGRSSPCRGRDRRNEARRARWVHDWSVQLRCRDGSHLTVPVCNEFIAVLSGARPIASFPDLVALFDLRNGLPIGSAEAEVSRSVAAFVVPSNRLILGRAMHDRDLLAQVERLVGLRIDNHQALIPRPAVGSGLSNCRRHKRADGHADAVGELRARNL